MEQIKDVEEVSRDNTPDNLQGSSRYEACEERITTLEDVIEKLGEY